AIQSALENDVIAPAPVSNLRVTSTFAAGRTVTLAWTASGDDVNGGTAADYDFFYVNPTTGVKTLLPTNLAPAPPGTAQSVVITTPYRNFNGAVRLRTYDNAGNSTDTAVAVTIPADFRSDPYSVALSAGAGLSPVTGTSLVAGDDKYVDYTLPFAFPFYGVNRTGLTISTNGVLYFSVPPRRDDGDADDAGSAVQNMQGQRMIAGLWDDIDINQSLRADSGVFVTQTDANHVVIRWQGVTFLSPRVNVNMEIELRSDGAIQMRYGQNPRIFPVVGISNSEPDAYVIASHTRESLSSNQPISLTNAQTVTFTPRLAQSFSISGSVRDASGAGVPNVNIFLSGGRNAMAMTSGTGGGYSFTGLTPDAGYTITPSHPGYNFTPTSINIASLTSDQVANFTAARSTACAQNQPITFGQTVSGTLANGDCQNPVENDGSLVDEYIFNGTAGQQVTITMQSSAFDTVLYLLGPDGSQLAFNDDIDRNGTPPNRNSRIVITLPESGVFSILANSFAPEERGAYTL
ncbi:MAG TPA: carboxypeptidase regulatory-like domain-containing protein, partial [Pyrinomonadaceae bacterium]